LCLPHVVPAMRLGVGSEQQSAPGVASEIRSLRGREPFSLRLESAIKPSSACVVGNGPLRAVAFGENKWRELMLLV
jgi:hypothetical protein